MRIAMMTYSTQPRGGVVHSCYLAEALSELGEDVAIFSLGPPTRMYRDVAVDIEVFPVKDRENHNISLARKTQGLIQSYSDFLPTDFDIYHTHDCIGANALNRLKAQGKITAPTVRTIHHIDPYKNGLLLKLQEEAIRKCDVKIVVSKFWQDILLRNYGEKAEIIYNGVDLSKFRPDVNGANIRKTYGFDDEPIVLFVGGLEPRKGLEYLIFAFKKVLIKQPKAKLIVVGSEGFVARGETGFFDYLIQKLEIQESVIFQSKVPDEILPQYYATCDVFVLPSRLEGWGLSLMEAMATQKPVVASKVGGIPEFITNRYNGFLIKPGDIHQLKHRILMLL